MSDNIIKLKSSKSVTESGTLPLNKYNNGDGGGNMDNDKYVTFKDLEYNNERLLHEMDKRFNELDKKLDQNTAQSNLNFEKINTKFEKQKVWFYGTAIAIVSITCTVVGLLIKFIK